MACGGARRFSAKKMIDMERFIYIKIILHRKKKNHAIKGNKSTDYIIHEEMCFTIKCFFTAEVL